MPGPVFIVGAPRSGTTFLYHVLLSSGGFADYRTESRAYDLIGPRFGNLRTDRARREFLEEWTRGYKFERTGLEESWVREKVASECRGTGDFLRIIMEGITEDQGAQRWADCTPTHALFLSRIAQDFPDARVIHMIRDGRDVALSLQRQGWVGTLPGDRGGDVVAAALYWSWICRRGRDQGQNLGDRYREIRFEDLVEQRESALDEIASFVDHRIDWREVQERGIGSVRRPNTSFEEESFNPVGRWREMSVSMRTTIENHVGPLLRELGYLTPSVDAAPVGATVRRGVYRAVYEAKHYLRSRTPLGRILIRTDNLIRP